jgi:hypothetical protein
MVFFLSLLNFHFGGNACFVFAFGIYRRRKDFINSPKFILENFMRECHVVRARARVRVRVRIRMVEFEINFRNSVRVEIEVKRRQGWRWLEKAIS